MHRSRNLDASGRDVRLAVRGWPGVVALAAPSLAAGLATFALVVMKHDRRAAANVISHALEGTPVLARPLDGTWHGPDVTTMAVGTAVFAAGWAVLLAPTVRLARDRYTGLRLAAWVALVVATVATVAAAAAFLVVRHHAVHPDLAWWRSSWLATKLGGAAVLVAVAVLVRLRGRLPGYLRAAPPRCPGCGYDVRGTAAAGGRTCSECGSAIPAWLVERATRIGPEGPVGSPGA